MRTAAPDGDAAPRRPQLVLRPREHHGSRRETRPAAPGARHRSGRATPAPSRAAFRDTADPDRAPDGDPLRGGLRDPLTHPQIVAVLVDPRAQSRPRADERFVHDLDAPIVDREQPLVGERVDDGAAVRIGVDLVPREPAARVGRVVARVHEPEEQASSGSCVRRRRAVRTRARPTARSRRRRHRPPGTRRASAAFRAGAARSPAARARRGAARPGSSPASSRIASVRPGSSRNPARCAGP